LAVLLDHANDLEIRDSLGWTPLMTAVNRGSKDNAKLLLERGAKIDCDSLKGMHLIATAMGFHDIGMYHRRFFLYLRAN
jgi:ankyrin repeat protein